MSNRPYRQGDVLVMPTNQDCEGFAEVPREDGRIVLAHGEVTGHSHAIDAPAAILFMDQKTLRRYLWSSEPMRLLHEEHDPIVLPAGTFEVIRQREYHPEDIRQVAD